MAVKRGVKSNQKWFGTLLQSARDPWKTEIPGYFVIGRLRGCPIPPLHRHRLLRCGDARIQLQGAPGVCRRGLRHTETGSAAQPWWYWTRRGLAEWLCPELGADSPTLVGIDHGFSFPIAYFDRHRLPRDWPGFLVDLRPCALRGRRSIILAMQEVLSKTAEPEAPLEG